MKTFAVGQPSLTSKRARIWSWAAVAAGGVAAAALTLVLIALGAGLGLSAISPWRNSGVSAATFEVGTGVYLVIVSVMSSAVGGYLAGRLRTKWTGLHSNEVFFRDTAHGFLAWGFATLIGATVLASSTAYLANGGAARPSTQSVARGYADKLLRMGPAKAPQPTTSAPIPPSDVPNEPPVGSNIDQSRAEVARLWLNEFDVNHGFNTADRAYVARVVAERTGISQADAEKRVDQIVAEAKMAADNARRNAAHLSFWFTAALLFGAFAASLAAAEGGMLRDGSWNGHLLTPRAL